MKDTGEPIPDKFSAFATRNLAIFKIAFLVVLMLGVVVALWLLARIEPSPFGVQQPTHSELIATLFTGAALMLGVLAIIVAGLAIWGYIAIKKEAAGIATSSAKREIERYMKTPRAQREMKEIIERLAAPAIARSQEAAQMPSAYQSTSEPEISGKTIGKSYPEK